MIPSSFCLVAGLTPSMTSVTAMTKSTSVRFADITSVDDLSMDQREGDVVIDLSNQGGGSITLQDFVIADLDASDFIF